MQKYFPAITKSSEEIADKQGGGIFILIDQKYNSIGAEELHIDNDCEMLWAQLSVIGVSSLYIGAFYRPPNMDQPEYLSYLDTCLARIPEGAHLWIGGDFNLGDINWDSNSVRPSSAKPKLSQQLLELQITDILNSKWLNLLELQTTPVTH